MRLMSPAQEFWSFKEQQMRLRTLVNQRNKAVGEVKTKQKKTEFIAIMTYY